MRRALALVWLLASLSLAARGQAYTTVTASNVTVDNGTGSAVHPPSGSSLCFLGVNNSGAPITYTPSGGSPVSGTVCQTLNGSGALTGTLQVANPATASPLGLLYTITVVNGSTTYLTIPTVSLSGTIFNFDSFSLLGTSSANGIGKAHLACASGAQWSSTTLPPGQNNQRCNTSGLWDSYPPANYCPAGMAYLVPQQGGTPICQAPTLEGNGAPSGSCFEKSTYLDVTGGGFYACTNGAWSLKSSSSPGVTSIQGAAGAFTFNGGGFAGCTTSGGTTTCTFNGGSGLTSLNGLTGPALTVGSADKSIAVTPSGTNIDLKNLRYTFSLVNFSGLVGAFTDSSGNVIEPLWIGLGPVTLTLPPGATQLQLGIQDTYDSDNTGSWTVSVNGANYTVLGTAQPWANTDPKYPISVTGGTSPTVVPITPGSLGTSVTVAYVSGTVTNGGAGTFTAAGSYSTYQNPAGSPGYYALTPPSISSNPMTAAGDIVVGGTSGYPLRLPGSTGYLHQTSLGTFVWDTPAGSGSVTSVGLSLPASLFNVAGSPVTSSGTLSASFVNQAANQFFAGPSTGSPATPIFRAIVSADLPLGSASQAGALQCGTGTSCSGGVISASGSSSVNVNGSPVSNPNFGSTPAAGTNGKNVTWQNSGSNVSAEVVGDGNASHYLDGTGNYSTPSGGSSTPLISRVSCVTYGCTADGNVGANTGTDNTTPFTNCLAAAVTAKGVCYVPAGVYRIATSLPTVNTSGTGFVGDVWGTSGGTTWTGPSTTIFSSSSSATILTVSSGGSSYITGDHVENISLQRGVTAAAASIALLMDHAGGTVINRNNFADSATGADITNSPAYGVGLISNNSSSWGYNGISCPTAPLIGFNLHGGGTGFVSMRMERNTVSNNGCTTGTSYGFKADGNLVDLMMDHNEVAGTSYGVYFVGSVGQDVHILNQIDDGNLVQCEHFDYSGAGISTNLQGGWCETSHPTGGGTELHNVQGVKVSERSYYDSGGSLPQGVLINTGSTANAVVNNFFYQPNSIGINCNGANGNNFSGNTFNMGGAASEAIELNNCSKNTVMANKAYNGTSTVMKADSSSNNNTYINLNQWDSSGTAISDAGSGNQLTSGTTTNALTMNNSGSGAASGAAFDGSAAKTISYNTIGAQQTLTLTTTGTSGAATLVGGALNIPNYATGGTTVSTFSCADSSGSGTAQTCTASPTLSSLSVNTCIAYTTTTSNTGALTLNVSGLGAKSVVKWLGTALASGDMPANKSQILCYDGTNWNASTIGNAPTGGGGTFQYTVLGNPPAIGTFTWANQGSSTSSNNGNAIMATIDPNASLNVRILKKSTAFSTPWSVAAFWKASQAASSSMDTGLYIYDGTKLEGIEFLTQNSGVRTLRVQQYTNATTAGSTVYTQTLTYGGSSNGLFPAPDSGGWFMRWRDNGTTLFADYSLDGSNWTNFYSESVGSFITPNAYGFGGVDTVTSTTDQISIQGWLETNSATL